MQPGDMVLYSFCESYDTPSGPPARVVRRRGSNKRQLIGLVVRGGKHNAWVLLNGAREPSWIDAECLEVISESR